MKSVFVMSLLYAVIMVTSVSGAVAADDPNAKKESSDERDDDPRKFYQFHLDGVTSEGAKSDYLYCSNLSSKVTSNNDTMGYGTASGGGLLGGIIEGVQKAVEANRMQHASLRKCMAMFGYDRYFQAKADYDAAHSGTDSIDKIAATIAGPKPITERLPK